MNKVIVSLTSYSARVNTVYKAIESILSQTMPPAAVILWLSPEEFPNKEKKLPRELLGLSRRGLIIDWCKNIKSYNKLIFSLQKYPDDIIITVDDDIIYHNELIRVLYETHIKYPRDIIAHRITRLYKNKDNRFAVLPRHLYYRNFTGFNYVDALKNASYFNKLTGSGGVLYPPYCLHNDVLLEELFTQLAPTSDDIWFWLMGMLNKVRVRVPEKHFAELKYIPGTQKESLSSVNDHGEKLFFCSFE
jgi:hypothetical protein